jgi:hypothetical protein
MRWSRLLFVIVFFSMLHAQDIPKQTERTVFLTHRKFWLASGGFNPTNQSRPDKALLDYIKDFRKPCPKIIVTDAQGIADYAVTIDYIGLFQSNALTFQIAVYSRNAGLVYMGGTNLLKNAIKDACNAIGTIK